MDKLKLYRQRMLSYPTKAEVFFYNKLKDYYSKKQLYYRHLPIERQVIIGWYIVDFLLPHKELIIELDGNQHFTFDGITDDIFRTAWLKEIGFDIVRYSNNEIMTKSNEIIEYIDLWASLNHPMECYYNSKRYIRMANRMKRKNKLERIPKSKELV